MYSLEVINAINAKDGPKLPQGATVKVDTTHRRLNAIDSQETQSDDGDDGQYAELMAERPLSPHRKPATPAWLHRIYFGTGSNAGSAVEKGQDVLDVARSFIFALADRFFEGYTLYEAQGRWQEETEHSFILEVITSRRDQYQTGIVGLAQLYRDRFKQDVVIVTHTQVWTEFV